MESRTQLTIEEQIEDLLKKIGTYFAKCDLTNQDAGNNKKIFLKYQTAQIGAYLVKLATLLEKATSDALNQKPNSVISFGLEFYKTLSQIYKNLIKFQTEARSSDKETNEESKISFNALLNNIGLLHNIILAKEFDKLSKLRADEESRQRNLIWVDQTSLYSISQELAVHLFQIWKAGPPTDSEVENFILTVFDEFKTVGVYRDLLYEPNKDEDEFKNYMLKDLHWEQRTKVVLTAMDSLFNHKLTLQQINELSDDPHLITKEGTIITAKSINISCDKDRVLVSFDQSKALDQSKAPVSKFTEANFHKAMSNYIKYKDSKLFGFSWLQSSKESAEIRDILNPKKQDLYIQNDADRLKKLYAHITKYPEKAFSQALLAQLLIHNPNDEKIQALFINMKEKTRIRMLECYATDPKSDFYNYIVATLAKDTDNEFSKKLRESFTKVKVTEAANKNTKEEPKQKEEPGRL